MFIHTFCLYMGGMERVKLCTLRSLTFISQPMSILMIVVGAKFVTVNGRPVPVAWTIAALTLIGAIITSKPPRKLQIIVQQLMFLQFL